MIAVGDTLPERSVTLDQGWLIRYAGASGDFNPLHWDPGFAAGVSPTGEVIAHGMLNAGLVGNAVAAWAGGAERVRSLTTAFRAPCPVGATVTVGGQVLSVDADAGTATLAVWAELADGAKVVDRKRSRAVVALS